MEDYLLETYKALVKLIKSKLDCLIVGKKIAAFYKTVLLLLKSDQILW